MKSLIEYINEGTDLEYTISGTEGNFDYVDLELPSGTMWATCNVGADKIDDYGLLFQWGRTDGYKYGDKNHQLKTKEQNEQETGMWCIPQTVSGKKYNRSNNTLDLEDDAAHANMGGKWRMPTKDEFYELMHNTYQRPKTINGVKGVLFISTINRRSTLFIPLSGYWDEFTDKFETLGRYTCVWTSTLHPRYYNLAYTVDCNINANVSMNRSNRSSGYIVRGVFKK